MSSIEALLHVMNESKGYPKTTPQCYCYNPNLGVDWFQYGEQNGLPRMKGSIRLPLGLGYERVEMWSKSQRLKHSLTWSEIWKCIGVKGKHFQNF
jgi:hypothetical protein